MKVNVEGCIKSKVGGRESEEVKKVRVRSKGVGMRK